MTHIDPKPAFREYCHTYYQSLRNPFSDVSDPLDPGDLDASIEICDSILSIGPSAEQFRGLENRFYAAFRRYVTEPRTDIGTLANTVDRLANLVEPFLKKIAYHFLPSESVTIGPSGGGRNIPLWKTNSYPQILERLGLVTMSDLYRDQPAFWEGQLAGVALLRVGFASRHRGAHESRIQTLEELEATAYAVIGQYLVICLHLLRRHGISSLIQGFVEKARVTYLLRERARSYALTESLLSRREHLLLYRHRRDIAPEDHEKKFLFFSYLAGHGPVFYWLGQDRSGAIGWARSALQTSSDELVKKNAVVYLLRNGERIPLTTVLATLGSYADKTDLAKYLRLCATREDKGELLALATSRKEEVALAATELFASMCKRTDPLVKRLAGSASESRQVIFRATISQLARSTRRKLYRTFSRVSDAALQIAYIHCLGEVGTTQDAKALEAWLRQRLRDERRRAACTYALTRICGRLRRVPQVRALLRSRSRACFVAAVDGLTRQALGRDLDYLLAQANRGVARKRKVCEALLRLATKADLATLRRFFANSPIDNNTRDLVLALCRVGTVRDCLLILRRISTSRSRIDLFNHVRIADALAPIAGKRLRPMLIRALESAEFWKYIEPASRRPRRRLPIRHIDNQALMRRLLAACFIQVASRRDAGRIKELLMHNYDWIAQRAAEKLSELGRETDLDELNEKLLRARDVESSELNSRLKGLCALDRSLYESRT